MHSIAWQKWYALHCDELMIRCVTYCVRYLTNIRHLNTRRQLRLRPFWARARDVLKCTNRFTYLFFYFSVMLLSYANNTLKLTLCLLFNSAVTCIFNFACLFIFTYFVCLWHEPSVCRLWRCCTLGRDLNFSTIFLHQQLAQRLGHFVLKCWGKNSRVLGDGASKIQWGKKNWCFRPIYRFISKTVKDTAIVTIMEDE